MGLLFLCVSWTLQPSFSLLTSLSMNWIFYLFQYFQWTWGGGGRGLDSCFWQCPAYPPFFKPGESVYHCLWHYLTFTHFFEPLKCPLCKIAMTLAQFGLDCQASSIPTHSVRNQLSTLFLSPSGWGLGGGRKWVLADVEELLLWVDTCQPLLLCFQGKPIW